MNLTPKRYPTAESARQNWLQWSGSLRGNNGTPAGGNTPSKVPDKDALSALESMFPDWDSRDLQQMLKDNKFDGPSAIDAIFKMDGPPRPKGSPAVSSLLSTVAGIPALDTRNDWDVPLLGKLNNYGENGTKKGIRGSEVGPLLRGYDNLLQWIPDTDTPAIAEPLSSERSPLTHRRLRQFITEEFDLCRFGLPVGCRVSVLLPNGPELAVAMISVLTRWCAAPINPTNTKEEIRAELESTRALAIIIMAGAAANDAALHAAQALGIGVIVITPTGSISGLFHLALLHKVPEAAAAASNFVGYTVAQTAKGFVSYDHPETVLLLHTSGTSGNKKLVPYSLDMIVVGVACIVSSWNLTPADVCLNMMPLFHIGGIMRNILSPVLSGGCVIACSGFDPLLFWDVLTSPSPATMGTQGPQGHEQEERNVKLLRATWYYAAPTMHHAILMEAERRPLPLPVASVRFIANAAGGLLPVLAESLRTTFGAVILTSYGMTECMPISSPPQTYRLDPTGTSGIAVGPEIKIADVDQVVEAGGVKVMPTGTKGNILVRGPPCFGGYENNGSANEESFFVVDGQHGWFNTGDMGHLDEQGYLFISGRSKEIINRGGETISPFEIEEAVVQHPSVKECLAFSAPHQQFQETVGCIIVTKAGMPRVDLVTLHKYLDEHLHRSKWPYVLVYSDALPKNAANKILRIRYAERCGMGPVDEESSPLSRLYEAPCPPVGAPLTQAITLTPLASLNAFEPSIVETFLKTGPSCAAKLADMVLKVKHAAVVKVDLPFRPDSFAAFVTLADLTIGDDQFQVESDRVLEAERLLQDLCEKGLPAYQVPVFVHAIQAGTGTEGVPVDLSGAFDRSALVALAQKVYADRTVVLPRTPMETQVEAVWRQQLGATAPVSVVVSFFDLGGDSLKAGQLINAMRKKLRVQLAVADLFTAPTIEAMARKVALQHTLGSPSAKLTASGKPRAPSQGSALGSKHRGPGSVLGSGGQGSKGSGHDDGGGSSSSSIPYESYSPFSNRSLSCLFTQAMPLVVVFPMRRIAIWFIIAAIWVEAMNRGQGRFHALIIAMVLSRMALGVGAPLAGILAKWLIIGRYKPGRYPLWGSMYLRWWLVEQIINIMGRGVFKDDFPIIGVHLVRLYYVLMGASVGANVKIHKDARLGQADLLTIGNDVVIDVATIRPFSLEEGYFVLLPITIGDRCSVGLKSQVAAGATLESGTCLGPLSSSHEKDDAEPHYRNYCRTAFKPPPAFMILMIGCPLLLAVTCVGLVPWYYTLRYMVTEAKSNGWYEKHIHSVYHAFLWWITPQRLIYYFLLRVVRRCVVPFMRLFLVILIKWIVIGRFTPLTAEEKEHPWNRFRYWLMSKLLPGGGLSGVARLVGTHYEIVSIVYRLLGAKVGERVYWPGSGLDIVEYDLLTVGDDVVFGSRSVVLTSTAVRSAPVVFESGSMVADRCVVLPGVTLSKGSVLGSGSLAPEDFVAAVGSVWVGSSEGSAVNVAPADPSYNVKDTLSPFGRAFYQHDASYEVIPLWAIVAYNTAWQAFCTSYRNSPTALSLIMCQWIMEFDHFDYYSPMELFRITLAAFIPLHLALCILALAVGINSKWYLLGRRKQGAYPWDESNYCQNWQLYLTIEEIRRGERRRTGVLDMIQGSQYLVWYFQLLGATIGRNVCLYPNGGDPMMTEPDLVTIGDDAGVDDASLIAHINTRGIFRLNPLTVGSGCVLKAGTRLLSGASMESHSMMLEHTLVMAGECVDEGTVWQGWPSKRQFPLPHHRATLRKHLDHLAAKHRSRRTTDQGGSGHELEDDDLVGLCSQVCCCCCSGESPSDSSPLGSYTLVSTSLLDTSRQPAASKAAAASRSGSRNNLLRVGGPSGATGLTPTAVANAVASASVVELSVTKSVAVQPPASDTTPLLPRGAGGGGANGYGSQS